MTNSILMCLYFALQRRKYCQLTSTYTFPNLLMKFVIRLCMKPPLAHHKSFRDCEYNFANGKSSLFFSIDRLGIWESAHMLCKTGSCSFKHQGINLLMTLRECNSNLKKYYWFQLLKCIYRMSMIIQLCLSFILINLTVYS